MSKLSPKHWKALELIEEGQLSLKEIAASVGWSSDILYDLYEGNTQKTGPIGELFVSELKKVEERNASKVKSLVKENKKLALWKMNERLRELQSKKATPTVMKEINMLMNSLNKATPGVEIGSFSYTQGLTVEDLSHEFRRLSGIARASLDGRGVRSALEAGQGLLPASVERGSAVSEE